MVSKRRGLARSILGAAVALAFAGTVQAQTTNGAITLEGGRLESMKAETVNGTIAIVGLSAGCQVDARTVNGVLDLGLLDGVQAEVDASGLSLGVSLGVANQAQTRGRATWRGTVGQGQPGANVTYHTINGRLQVSGAGKAVEPQPVAAQSPLPEVEAPGMTATHSAAPVAPQSVKDILNAIERGEMTVDQALGLMGKANSN